jgi:uncharacterized protein (TIGR03067 family)
MMALRVPESHLVEALMKTRWMVVGLVALSVCAGRVAAKKEAAEEARVMKYKYVAVTHDGKEVPKDQLEDMTLTVTGNKGVVKKGDKVLYEGKSKVDMTKKPWHIDITISQGEDKGKVSKGIMKVEDGKLTICFGKAGGKRPKEFKSEEGSGNILEVLEEIK